jgi:hypothetical protein
MFAELKLNGKVIIWDSEDFNYVLDIFESQDKLEQEIALVSDPPMTELELYQYYDLSAKYVKYTEWLQLNPKAITFARQEYLNNISLVVQDVLILNPISITG